MKPAVFRPAIASRVRCSIGSRTSACTPLMKARPCSSEYLSSSVTVSRALRTDSGRGAFMGVSLEIQAGEVFSLFALQGILAATTLLRYGHQGKKSAQKAVFRENADAGGSRRVPRPRARSLRHRHPRGAAARRP